MLEQETYGASPIVMQVTPVRDQSFNLETGNSPAPFVYNIAASRSQVNFRVSGLPSWMRTNMYSGRTPEAVTFTVDSSALAAGNYSGQITFTNTDNGAGNTLRNVTLVLTTAAPPITAIDLTSAEIKAIAPRITAPPAFSIVTKPPLNISAKAIGIAINATLPTASLG